MTRKRMFETISVNEQSIVMADGRTQQNNNTDITVTAGGSSSGVHKKKRGKTVYKELQDLPPDRRVPISVNEWGQPVGDNARLLSGWAGVIVRLKCPLHYPEWRKVPKATKARLKEHIEEKFQLPETIDTWLKKTMGKRFRDAKHGLKSSNFSAKEPEEFNLNNCPPDINPNDWENLVTHWLSDEGKEAEERNKRSRGCQISSHTTGSKSFARVEHELNVEAGRKVGKLVVMEKTHMRKDGTFIDPSLPSTLDKVKQTIDKLPSEPSYMEELEILSVALGAEKNGMIRGMGLGPTPTTVFRYRYTATSSHTTQEFNSLKSEVSQQRELIREQNERLSKQEELILRQEEKMSKQEDMIKGLDEKLDRLMLLLTRN